MLILVLLPEPSPRLLTGGAYAKYLPPAGFLNAAGFALFLATPKFTLANQQEPTHHACKTGMAYAKNLPVASFINAAALTAVSDQGPCPWTLVAFVKAPQNLNSPAGLELCYGLRFTAPASRSRPRSTAKSSPLSRSVRSHTPYTAVPRWSGRCIPSTALPPLPVWG